MAYSATTALKRSTTNDSRSGCCSTIPRFLESGNLWLRWSRTAKRDLSELPRNLALHGGVATRRLRENHLSNTPVSLPVEVRVFPTKAGPRFSIGVEGSCAGESF